MLTNILDAIGHTPLVQLKRFLGHNRVQLFAKLEGLNPGGSIKDRPAYAILKKALDSGEINRDTVVIESSSGNMGIGLAQACCYLNLRFICVVDPKITTQNKLLLKTYGAEVSLVDTPDPHTGEFLRSRLKRVAELLLEHKTGFWPNQYANRDAALAHYATMSEIMNEMDGDVDYLFCSTSTCGTLRGCSEYLSAQSPHTKVVAVDAVGSVIFGSPRAKRLIPGHGASDVPSLFDQRLANRCVHVSDLECIIGCRRMAYREAILVGGSSGAVAMAVDSMSPELADGARCVAIFPDKGERYLDTIFSDEWIRSSFRVADCDRILSFSRNCLRAAEDHTELMLSGYPSP